MSDIEVLKRMVDEMHIKEFAFCIAQMFEHRKNIMYK